MRYKDLANYMYIKDANNVVVCICYYYPTDKTGYIQYKYPEGKTQAFIAEDREYIEASKEEISKFIQDEDLFLKNDLSEILHYSFQVGCDPEMFVESKGEILPAFKFLPNKETAPIYKGTGSLYGGNHIYWDGFQAEFDVIPNNCLSYMVDSVQAGLEGILVNALNVDKDATITNKTVISIPEHVRMISEEQHIQFGCNPSLNAYGMSGYVGNGREVATRSAGGHIHFGCGDQGNDTVKIIKALDAILGVACVSLFAKFDYPSRRKMYGLAGEYRTPKHGIEYRTLSNSWLMHPLMCNLVFDLARKAFMMGKKDLMGLWNATEKETIDCINNCDVSKAREILIRNEKVFKRLLSAIRRNRDPEKIVFEEEINAMYNIFLKGAETVIENPSDIKGNWLLTQNKWINHCESPGANWKSFYEGMKAAPLAKAA